MKICHFPDEEIELFPFSSVIYFELYSDL